MSGTPSRRGAIFSILPILAAPRSRAADAQPARSDLFVSGTHGNAVYRIPGLAVTSSGSLLAYAEARKTTGSDWDAISLVLRRSEDRGATWSPQQVIGRLPGPISPNPVMSGRPRPAGAITYNNPVAVPGRKRGDVLFVYCVEYQRAYVMRSADGGRTFSAPVDITPVFEQFRPEYNWKVIATGPGHGIRLRNGRLLIPVWLSTSETGPHHPSVVSTIYSDDGGSTWRRGAIAAASSGEILNPSEAAAVQLSDGRVMLNIRSESKQHRRLVATSPDGATGWSAPRFQEELAEPICFGSLVRHSGKRLLFVNPGNLLRGGGPGEPGRPRDRRNLTVQLSEDDGITWKVKRVIDPSWSGYADINVDPSGSVYVLYERGEPDDKRFRIAALTLVRFPLSWVREGRRMDSA